jgi:chitodextrinase
VLVDFLKDEQSNDFSGANYSYRDDSVEPETTYCYLLEDVDFNGNRTRHWNLITSVTTR